MVRCTQRRPCVSIAPCNARTNRPHPSLVPPLVPRESRLSHRIPPVPPNPAYPTESRLSHRIPLIPLIPLIPPNPTCPTESHLSHRIPLIPPNPTCPTESHSSRRIPLIPPNPACPTESHLSHLIPLIPPNPTHPTESHSSHLVPANPGVPRWDAEPDNASQGKRVAGRNEPAMTRRGPHANGSNLLDRIANSAGSSRGCGSARAPAIARTRPRCWIASGARYPARGSGSRRRRPRCRPW